MGQHPAGKSFHREVVHHVENNFLCMKPYMRMERTGRYAGHYQFVVFSGSKGLVLTPTEYCSKTPEPGKFDWTMRLLALLADFIN